MEKAMAETSSDVSLDPTTWTSFEMISHAIRLAKQFLNQRGMRTNGTGWDDGECSVPIVAREEDGEVVLIDVRSVVDPDPHSMPSLEISTEDYDRYRSTTLRYLLAHPEVGRVRLDVLSFKFIGGNNAKIRHLVGCMSWDS